MLSWGMLRMCFFVVAASFAAGCLRVPASGGRSCGATAPNVRLRAVERGSGAPVPFVVIVDGVAPTGAACHSVSDGGAPPGDTCVGDLDFILVGAATIDVDAAGFTPATMVLDGGDTGGDCAAPRYTFDLWVPLSAS